MFYILSCILWPFIRAATAAATSRASLHTLPGVVFDAGLLVNPENLGKIRYTAAISA